MLKKSTFQNVPWVLFLLIDGEYNGEHPKDCLIFKITSNQTEDSIKALPKFALKPCFLHVDQLVPRHYST